MGRIRKIGSAHCNYSQILYQFLTFTQNLKRSLVYEQILDAKELIYFPYKVPAASIPKRFPRPCYELPTKISAILEAKQPIDPKHYKTNNYKP